MSSRRSQQLFGINTTASPQDNLLAPVKDPLWFLAMQWRTGEFEAENGGSPAQVEVRTVDHPLTELRRGEERLELDLARPFEYDIEHEDEDEGSPAWHSAALAYDVEVSTDRHALRAGDYPGNRLDWYHFDLIGTQDGADGGQEQVHDPLPTTMRVRGAPDPRWWRFESAGDEPLSPVDPEPNVLSMLLPEFVFIDGNNWFLVPVVQRAGTVRDVTLVRVTDVFGVTTELGPAIAPGTAEEWAVFVLSGDAGAIDDVGGRLLFVPHIALDVLHNDDVEEVRFVRDEEANLVWAYERLYQDADGNPVYNGDDPTGSRSRKDAPDGPGGDDRSSDAVGSGEDDDSGLRFVLADPVPPWWVPYVPRFRQPGSATDGEIYLRRGRTVEDTRAGAQYRSQIVGESWRLDEHEIPRTGVRVRRLRRSARGSDGEGYHWVGRSKQTGQQTAHPERRYDELRQT